MNNNHTINQFLTLLKLDMWTSGRVENAGWIKVIEKKDLSPIQWHHRRFQTSGQYARPETGIHILYIMPTGISADSQRRVYQLGLAIDELHLSTVTEYVISVTNYRHEKWIQSLTGSANEYQTTPMPRNNRFMRAHQAIYSLFTMQEAPRRTRR